MLPSVFEPVSLRPSWFSRAVVGPLLAGAYVSDLDRPAKPGPRRLPLRLALALIAALSLALWAGIGLLVRASIFH